MNQEAPCSIIGAVEVTMFFFVVVCRAATREAGLKGLIRAFTQEVMSNYVENKYVYFLSLNMSSLLLHFFDLI